MPELLPTELVAKLRAHSNRDNCVSHDWGGEYHDAGDDCDKAADEIVRLFREINRLMGFMPEHDTRETYRCTECGAFHLRLHDDVTPATTEKP